MAFSLHIKRVYEKPSASDGYRILIDRLWPRGLTRDRAAIHEWMKELVPSHELRRWFGHDPDRWAEFQIRYRAELERGGGGALLNAIRERTVTENVTLLFAAKSMTENNAAVLKQILDAQA